MKPGFDVCLHNKRLNLDMPGLVDASRQQVMDEPKPAVQSGTKASFRCSPPVTWKTHVLNAIGVVHLGLLIALGIPVWIGSLVRDTVLIVAPCAFIQDVNQWRKLQVFVLHVTGVATYAIDSINQTYRYKQISLPFYLAAIMVLLLQIYSKVVKSRMQECMTAFACLGILLGGIVRMVDIATHWQFLDAMLDSCFLLVFIMAYVSIECT